MAANRTSNYIATIPMKNEEQVLEVKKVLEQIFGWVTLRGRHSDRKKVLGRSWSKSKQNDIPWRQSQYIDIYLHHANPNRMRLWKKQGMVRSNLQLNNTSVMIARMLGNMGLSLADGVKNQQQSKQSDPMIAIMNLHHQTKMQDPAYKRKEMKRKYQNKSYKLQPGDWGYIAQELIDFVERQGDATHTELHDHYRKITNGSNSFSHCLANLRVDDPNRRCKRYIQKQGKRFCKGNYIVKHIN